MGSNWEIVRDWAGIGLAAIGLAFTQARTGRSARLERRRAQREIQRIEVERQRQLGEIDREEQSDINVQIRKAFRADHPDTAPDWTAGELDWKNKRRQVNEEADADIAEQHHIIGWRRRLPWWKER